jgi:hypothetical protein
MRYMQWLRVRLRTRGTTDASWVSQTGIAHRGRGP